MSNLMAAGHFFGAIAVSVAIGGAWLWVEEWEQERNRKRVFEEVAVELGVPHEQLLNDEMLPKILEFFRARFSDELLRNRLADFIGVLIAILGWTGMAIQLLILGGVAWFALTDDRSVAVFAWSIIPLNLLVAFIIVTVGIACRVLTARYPSQPRQGRKIVADAWNRHRSTREAAAEL